LNRYSVTLRENSNIDLHCHVLPGVDDGPADVETAVSLVQALVALGYREIYPTPHQKSGSFAPSAEEREAAWRLLHQALQEAGCPAILHQPGGENMWDSLFLERQGGQYPTYPGSKAFLIEFPLDTMPPAVPEKLFRYRLAGRLPVVAHVERYGSLTQDLRLLETLGRSAALTVRKTSACWRPLAEALPLQ
jgi:protein-tyrosine phosphatase